MRILTTCLVLLLAGCSSGEPAGEETTSTSAEPPVIAKPSVEEEGTPYSAPADPSATYSLLSVTPVEGGRIVAMTRRVGTSGTSFSNREIDCGAKLARYIGEGDSREEAEKPAPNPGEMASLVEGSSTWAAVQAACAKR